MPMTRARRTVPAGGGAQPGLHRLRDRVVLGDGDLPAGHPGGGGAVAGRGVPRRVRLAAPVPHAARGRRAPPGPGVRRAAHHLLGRGGRRALGGQAGQPARQARRRGRGADRPGDLVPAPARRRGALRRGREDPRAAAPARADHRRRRRAHPAADPAAGARAARRRPRARPGLGRRPPRDHGPTRRARARQEHRQRRDVRPRHRRPGGGAARGAPAQREGGRPDAHGRGWPAAP